MAHKTSLLDHLRWLRAPVLDLDGDLLVAGDTFRAFVRRGGRSWILEPRFLDPEGRVSAKIPDLEDPVAGFAGWLPYAPYEWELSHDFPRLADFLAVRSLPVPTLQVHEDGSLADVLVRRANAFGADAVRGPFRSSAERPLDPTQGEYYAPFLPGSRLRLWYWDGVPRCGELYAMTTVLGDGASTVRELILERALFSRPWPEAEQGTLLARAAPLVVLQGLALEAVPPRRALVAVDHAIESPLMHPSDRQSFAIDATASAPWLPTARTLGRELLSALPPEHRADSLFTVDAVLDGQGALWVQGADANPAVHPAVYPAIVGDLLARPGQPPEGGPAGRL